MGAHKLSMTGRALGPIRDQQHIFGGPILTNGLRDVENPGVVFKTSTQIWKEEERRKDKGRTNNGNLKNALLLKMNVEKGHAQTILAG